METNNSANPIPLIQFQDEHFFITQQAKQFLSAIDEPLGVVTIVGKYRTGKSLFLNKVLLANKCNADQIAHNETEKCNFKVCPTINSCTKGLWMSKQTIQSDHPEHQGMKVLVIDSQGFGAMQESDQYCNNILLLALLLSSYFIYNSVGSIDQKSLNSLNIITNLAKQLQSKNMKNQKLQQQFPTFMWVVRDFTLKIVDANGYQIEPKMYLEEALEIRKGVSDAIQSKNKIRRMIKHFFKERDCFTLITPVINQQKLQKLNTLPDHQFRPEFLDQIENLRQKITRRIKPKRLQNHKLTGPTFLELAQKYSEAINKGSLPNLQTTWKHIATFQTDRSIKKIQSYMINKIKQFSHRLHSQNQISQFEKDLLSDTLGRCKNLLVHQEQVNKHFEKLKGEIGKKIQGLRDSNKKNCMNEILKKFNSKNFQSSQYQNMSLEQCKSLIKNQLTLYTTQFNQNPALLAFLAEYFYPLHLESLYQFSKSSLTTSQKALDIVRQKNQQKQFLIDDLQKKLISIENLMESQKQQLQLRSIKNSQQIKVKGLECQFLQRENNEIKNDIQVLLSKIEKLEKDVEEEKCKKYELLRDKERVDMKFGQLAENQKYMEKQIEILKSNIASKNQQIQTFKQSLVSLNCQINNYQERQKDLSARIKQEMHSKNQQTRQLSQTINNYHQQITQLTRCITQLQTKLEQQQKHHLKEKNIYEDMFETLRNNLEVQQRNKDELIETNKNMGFALKHLEQRFQHIQEKENKLKQFKRCIKNSSCLQCINCSKFFVPSIFSQHLNVCIIGSEAVKNGEKEKVIEVEDMEIRVIQTLLKDSDSKPYTEYVLQIKKGGKTWKIERKYKQFCDLHSQLRAQFPGVGISENSYIVNPQEGPKKSLLVEQRRKILERYLNDVCRSPLLTHSFIFRQFIEDNSEPELLSIQSPSKTALSQLMKSNIISQMCSPNKENHFGGPANNQSHKSPQQFLKIWNERNIRAKQVAKNKKSK